VLYVSDRAGNSIYRIDQATGHRVSLLIHDDRLAGPAGLAVHPKTNHLIAVSWDKGKILEITPEGQLTELVSNGFFTNRFQNLSGVDFDRWGNMYVSDFTKGKIWRITRDNRFQVIAEYLPAPADIGIDRTGNLILVPYHYAHAAEINGLEAPLEGKPKREKRTLADYGFIPPPEPGREGSPGK
jgi:sugar lactone lactonase YvrE